jgi:hypothetical protein
VTPSKSGCTFSPVSQSVTVGPNATGKNFTASCPPPTYSISGNAGTTGATVSSGAASATTLFSDGFELSPSGWSAAQVSGTAGAWTLPTAGTHPVMSPRSGSRLALFNSYTAASGNQTRMYRATGFAIGSSFTTVTLTFWMYHDTGYSTATDRVQVQVSTNGGSTWTSVGTAVNRYDGSTGWKQHTVSLTAYKGTTVNLGFLGISVYGNDVHLDDVSVAGQ